MPETVKNGASKRPAARTDDTVTPPHGDPLEEQITPAAADVSRGDARRREIDMRAAQARWVKKHRQPGT
jgi:hypothetical protein